MALIPPPRRTAGSEPLMGAAAGLYNPAEGNEARQTRVKQLEAEVWGPGGGGLEAFYRPDSLGALLVAIIERQERETRTSTSIS